MVVLILCVCLPLCDLVIIPIRSGLAASAVNAYAKQLALSERFSQASRRLESRDELVSRLESIGGVSVKSSRLSLSISSARDESSEITVDSPGSIPPAWQPNGASCPCIYMLHLSVEAEISPLVIVPFGGKKIPGLNSAIPTTLAAQAPFENLGRDPVSKEYFVNE